MLQLSESGFDHRPKLARTIARRVCPAWRGLDSRMQRTICSTRCLVRTRGSTTNQRSLLPLALRLAESAQAVGHPPHSRNVGPWIGRNPRCPFPSLCYSPTNQWEEAMKSNYKMAVAALASVVLGLAVMLP